MPCSENGYAPDSLQVHAVRIMSVLVFITFAVINVQAVLWTKSDWLVSSVLPSVIVELTNEERSGDSLVTLKRNSTLDKAAQLKADHMATHEYFSHYSPDGVSPWYWFDQAQYSFVHAGENLAVHFIDSDAVVDAWMDSPGHRANILNGDFTEIGVGTAKGKFNGEDTIYVVQLFGTPAVTTPQTPSVKTEVAQAQDTVAPIQGAGASTETPKPKKDEGVRVAFARYFEKQDEVSVTKEDVPEPVLSDLATTSRQNVVPAVVDDIDAPPPEKVNVVAESLTQPGVILQTVYGLLSLFVLVLLLLSVIIEWRKQNPIQIAYGTGLLAAMGALFYIHFALTSTGVVT